MSNAGAGRPNLLRRLIKTIKRSPVLTRSAWWVVQRFPALGRVVARRMIPSVNESVPVAPVLIVPSLAWDASSPSTPASRPLQQQLAHALKHTGSGPQ